MSERPRVSAGGVPAWLLDELEPLRTTFAAAVIETPLAGLALLIETLQADLGRLLGASRATVFELTDDRRGFRPWQAWATRGTERWLELELHEGFEASYPRSSTGASRWVIPLRVGGATLGAHVIEGNRIEGNPGKSLATALQPLHGALAVALLRRRDEREQVRRHGELDEVERLAGSGHWTHNFALASSQGSAQLHQILRLDPRAELELRASGRTIHPEDRTRYAAFIAALLAGQDVEPIEVRARYGDGELRHLRCWGEISRSKDGQPRQAHGVVHDVTARKRNELALTALNHRLIRAQEEERARLAREIHDDLGQRLAALKLEIDLLGRDAEEGTLADGLLTRLRGLTDSAQEVATVARGLSHTLHPAMLEQLGLAAALEALCLRTTMLSEVDTSFEPGDVPEALDPEVALSVYRVAQEALGNVTRHSQARTATLSLHREDEALVLSIRDDGVGMTPRSPADAPGLGLLGMRERMHLVRGRLEITSTLGAGTCITARAPLAHIPMPEASEP